MRIITVKELIGIKGKAVYAIANEDSLCFEGPYIKHESCKDYDWFYANFTDWDSSSSQDYCASYGQMLSEARYPINKSISRDGIFDTSRQVLLYEPEDIKYIIDELQNVIGPRLVSEDKKIEVKND